MMQPDIYLASRSPRRRALLEQLGVRFAVVDQGVEEILEGGESPEMFVLRLALDKARSGLRNLDDGRTGPVLGADTVVVLEDAVLGKPAGRSDALAMLERLSGSVHRVLTALALVDAEREATRLSVSSVTFRTLSPSERRAYWDSGEPRDKAGAYAIQGRGAAFVQHLEGSHSGVMGLPLFELDDLLGEFGIDYRANWRAA